MMNFSLPIIKDDWVADCALYHVREGNFGGHPASLPARPDFDKEKYYP